ncbi:MAG: transporter substrate-binding protein [Pseudomonas sp.]|nr:transporter substrate-binding protein [Pseudomonas sp.]
MNSEEQTLIDGLFSKLRQAEADSAARDTQAEARIKEHLTQQPAVPYYMTQTILVQEAAVKQLDAQVKQLQAQLQQTQEQLRQAQSQPAPSSGGFLSSIFGGSRDPQPQAQQPSFSQPRPASPQQSAGGWRESGPSSPPPYNAPQGNYAPPPPQYQQPQAPAAPMGSGFLGGALKTAAGVAGGVMLAEGISSLFHHNQQPQEIVEVIREEPSRANDNGGDNGWGNDNQRVSDSGYGNNDGGFADNDYGNDDGGFSGDDDSYV